MSVVRPPEFDPKWRRKQRWGRRWRAWRAWLFVAVVIALSLWWSAIPSSTADADEINRPFTICGERGSGACVIDGDTLAIGKRRIRLSGYDAPELDGACDAENAKAREARAALHGWLNDGPFLLDGGEDPPTDQYGRELRQARRIVDGSDQWLSDWMVEQDLAEGGGWTDASVDWCEAG